MSDNVETMFSVREVPWHGLGTIVQEALNSAEAIKAAGLDWGIEQVPVAYKGQVSDYFMNVRSSDDKVLGVVGSRYKPVQNVEAFDFTDTLIGNGVSYETAGSLASGKRIWILAKMPEFKIFDDEINPFVCFTNSHDGFGSLKAFMTPVRVVCQNTLNLALNNAPRMWSARHTGSITAKMKEAERTLNLSSNYLEALKAEAKELYKIKVAPKKFVELQEALFPITEEMSNRKQESQDSFRQLLKNAWEIDDLGNLKGTGYGFMNAVSDMATHKPPARKTEFSQENSFMAMLDAPLLLDQALRLVRA